MVRLLSCRQVSSPFNIGTFLPVKDTKDLRLHTQLIAHIHLTAENYQPPIKSDEKNNLIGAKLTIFYAIIGKNNR
jgi:hypothetical protein